MIKVLDKYSINIGELLVILFRVNGHVFKKTFLNKIQDTIRYKKYAKNLVPRTVKKKSSKQSKQQCVAKENGKRKTRKRAPKSIKW